MKEVKNKKYIYAVKFANSIMEAGYKCLGTGYNAKIQRFYWVFDREEIQPFYRQMEDDYGGIMKDDKNSTKPTSWNFT